MQHGQRAPVEFDDAVEEWARQWGRHGRIEWNAIMRCWVIHLSRKPDDPLMKLYQEGELESEPTESIPITFYDKKKGHVTAGLDEIGVSGIISLLEEGNIWSGRGAYDSLTGSIKAQRERNNDNREEWREKARDLGRDMAEKSRRETFNLPLVSVPESLNTPTGA